MARKKKGKIIAIEKKRQTAGVGEGKARSKKIDVKLRILRKDRGGEKKKEKEGELGAAVRILRRREAELHRLGTRKGKKKGNLSMGKGGEKKKILIF